MEIKQKLLKSALVSSLILGVVQTFATTTVYEDAEDNATTGWMSYGNIAGATIENVFDTEKGNRVIKLTGNGKGTGYKIGSKKGRDAINPWNNETDKILQWSMKYAEDFRIYVSILTENGNRFLTYTNQDVTVQGKIRGGKVRYGLGSDSNDGTWHTFKRDLEADWSAFEPDNDIVSVNGFYIKGSGSVDDISLSDTVTVNQTPVADAGLDDAVAIDSVVQLDGKGSSDTENDELTYSWTIISKPAGSNAVLNDATSVNPTFVADEFGNYTFQLVVNDGTSNSLPDTVTVYASPIHHRVLSTCNNDWVVTESGGEPGTFDEFNISAIPQSAVFDFKFEAYSIPDKFKVAYPVDNVLLDSGWRGSILPNNGESLSGPGDLNAYNLFAKDNNNTIMTVQVSGEQNGTQWTYSIKCHLPQ